MVLEKIAAGHFCSHSEGGGVVLQQLKILGQPCISSQMIRKVKENIYKIVKKINLPFKTKLVGLLFIIRQQIFKLPDLFIAYKIVLHFCI